MFSLGCGHTLARMHTCSLRFQLGLSLANSTWRSPIPARSYVLGATFHRSVSQSTAAGHRRLSACRAAYQRDGRDTGTLSVSKMAQKCLTAVSVSLALAPAGLAEELVPYDGSGGQDLAKNVAGAAYIVFVIFVVVRRFMNRAKRATTERLGSSGEAAKMEDEEEWEEPEGSSNATPASAAIAALQAAAIAYVLFLAATYIDTLMLSQPLPEAYSVRNVAVTVRTIIRGIVYLATFVFAANSLGLAGLAIQLLLFPDADSGKAKPTAEKSEKSRLPDISLTSSPSEVRRAFDEASKGRMPSSTTKD